MICKIEIRLNSGEIVTENKFHIDPNSLFSWYGVPFPIMEESENIALTHFRIKFDTIPIRIKDNTLKLEDV